MYISDKEPDENHQFAYSEEHGRDIHISEATKSGRQGYLCTSCKRPMQAVLRKIYGLKPYFRHDPKDVKPSDRCAYKDEEYRRNFVINTLELEKVIKVPPLYKYPPKGVEGLAIHMLPSELIKAVYVSKKTTFYEDENGVVKFTKEFDPAMGDFLFQPDVILQNSDFQPILFIQIVKKYGLNPDQHAALKRIQINTIQITIPKDSLENIYKALMNGQRAKWIYNEDEQQLSYFSVSSDPSAGIPAIDSDQRKLLEESFDCRKVQINNLIRTVNRCLASEQYQSAERELRTAIGNVLLDIKRAEERRNKYKEKYSRAVESEYSGELIGIDERRDELTGRRERIRQRYKSLEARYFKKRNELDQEAKLLDLELQRQEKDAGRTGKTFTELRNQLAERYNNETQRIERQLSGQLLSIERERERIVRDINTEGSNLRDLFGDIIKAPERLERILLEERRKFDRLEATETKEIDRISEEQANFPERFRAEENMLRERIEGLRKQAYDTIEKRDAEGGSNTSKRLADLFSARRFVVAVQDARTDQSRYKCIKEFLLGSAFEEWLSRRNLG
ncbi:MAG: hypothetical protein JWQ25_2121 [Daejeonella sp.]|nr:hypothetical protein [Daejeonella sp.]